MERLELYRGEHPDPAKGWTAEDGDDTLESIARQVGYASTFALSSAFPREYGMRPSRYRERSRAGVP